MTNQREIPVRKDLTLSQVVTRLALTSGMAYINTNTYPTLARWRKARTFNQRQAAEYLGLSQSFYSKLERRVTALRGSRAQIASRKTGVPIEILVVAA